MRRAKGRGLQERLVAGPTSRRPLAPTRSEARSLTGARPRPPDPGGIEAPGGAWEPYAERGTGPTRATGGPADGSKAR